MSEPLKMPMAYKVQLSNKTEIPIEEEEVQKVMAAIASGNMVRVRRGIINPSFIVTIVEDADRLKEFREKIYEIKRHNEQDTQYHGGERQRALPQWESLKDIFDRLPQLGGEKPKRLT